MTKPIFDPRAPAYKADPYRVYKDLREQAPVFQNPDGSWVIAGYDACSQILSDRKRVRSLPPETLDRFPPGPSRDFTANAMSFLEGGDHQRVRGTMSAAFTASALAGMQTHIQAVCDELLNDLVQRESFDFAEDFAGPFPLYVICSLLGVSRDQRELFRRAATAVTLGQEPGASLEIFAQADQACIELRKLLTRNIAEREGTDGTDIISLLAPYQGTDRLSDDELINNLIFLLLAGHETTATLLAFGTYTLMDQPDLADQLRANPDLVPKVVEEFLRLHPPVQFTPRFTREEVVFGETVIPAGSQMTMLMGSANRDPSQFPNPDMVDLTRSNGMRHLTFVAGTHTCLGNNLARMEARTAFREILRRFPDLQPNGPPVANTHVMFQGFAKLPVRHSAQVGHA
ncbi:6-deoxyerythronolide B hydroxylase (plasmid) [Sphingobium sp. AntQ-1]|uniref:cytochrome P450 n=1 Tax=Sphingobium sp. AntQ-1 TaxID=2930091 RepID=UPI00234E52FF|nr:cytochrome P450 [Sphingobium sp. AntQ-1]WCP15925.1 6-deoxyerythronolide B hydroxylase [Sphingobium sp. AntQ-1]